MTDTTTLSPLTAISLDSIFSANPRELDDTSRRALLVELRRRRSEFRAQLAAKEAAPKAKRAKAEAVSAPKAAALDKPLGELDLGDLL